MTATKKRPAPGPRSPARRAKGLCPAAPQGPELEELLLKYWPQVGYRVKNSLGRFTPDWEDVVSEVFLDVITALRKGKFRGESSLGTFIYAVTTNKIVDRIRKKRAALPANEIPEPSRDPDPSVHVEAQERVQLVAGYLKRLKPKHADILYLHYYLDSSPGEIARIYGTSTRTVYKLIRTARSNLKGLAKALVKPR